MQKVFMVTGIRVLILVMKQQKGTIQIMHKVLKMDILQQKEN